MKLTKARLTLFIIFISGFILSLIPIMAIFFENKIYNEDATQAILKMLSIYSIYLTVIIGGILARQKAKDEVIPKTPFCVAFTVSILWNVLILWKSAAIYFIPEETIEDAIEYFELVPPACSFLVTGTLGYFFATKPKATAAKPKAT